MALRPFVALVAATLLAPLANAQTPLFTPLDDARVSLAPPQARFFDALATDLGVEAVAIVRADAALLGTEPWLTLPFPGAALVLETTSIAFRPSGHLSWTGQADASRAVAPGDAWGALVMRDGQITGSVWSGGFMYEIRPLTGGLHAVARKSMAAYRAHPEGYEAFVEGQRERIERQRDAHAARASPDTPPSGAPAPRAAVTVDLLVPYTTNVTAAYADPFALAQSFVDLSNVTYINSGLDLELRLVSAYETPFASTGDLETDLNNITGTADGVSDEVHARRSAYGADLVALISGTNTSGTCGIAWVNSNYAFGFSANSAGCGGLTLTHEVGHNFGAAHDPTTGGVVAYSYGRGYVNTAGRWGTVMAYDAACLPAGLCEIVPYLSNPDVSYTDTTVPIASGPTGDAATADNARVHEERAATLAAFSPEGTPPVLAYGPASLLRTLQVGETASRTLTIQNTAGAGSTPLNWSAALGNAAGPSPRVARAADGLRIRAEPLAPARAAPAPHEPAAGRRAPGSVTDCTDGQTIAQTSATTSLALASGGTEVGQTFVASCTGRLEAIAFAVNYDAAPNVTWGLTLRIYQGAGTGGAQLFAGSLSITNGPTGTFVLTLTPAAPIELTEGQAYAFFLDLTSNTTGTALNTANPYAGGTMLQTADGDPASATAVAGSDLYFRLDLLAPTTPSIPWVSLSKASGALTGGLSDAVSVDFDATGLVDGTYTADLVLTTNDVAAATTTIPVQLVVADAVAELSVGDGFGWRILASPLDGTTVGTLAGQNLVQGTPTHYPAAAANLYTGYDGTAWTPGGADAEALASGTGFAWYLFDQDLDLDPGDPSNSASVALPMTLAGAGAEPAADVTVALHADGDGWNLLGNPFLLALDVSGVDTWPGASALQSYVGQVWECAPSPGGCTGSYVTTTALGDAVPTWHGVFFDAATAGALTIPRSARGATSRRSSPRLVSFELASADGRALDRAATVVFREGADAGWDGWDAEKLAPLASPSVRVAFGGDREGAPIRKAQESRAFEPPAFEVPLYVGSAGAGSAMVLTWPRLDGLPAAWALTLTDLLTGAVVDLRSADRYAFDVAETPARRAPMPGAAARATDEAPRFSLRVAPGGAVATDAPATGETWLSAPTPTPARRSARVAYHLATPGPLRLTVVDLLGREVAVLAEGDRPAGSGQAMIPVDRLAPGLYIVRLEAAGRVWSQRAVVAR